MLCFTAAFISFQSVPHRLQYGKKSWLSVSSASTFVFAVRETFAYKSTRTLSFELRRRLKMITLQDFGLGNSPTDKIAASLLIEVTGWSTGKCVRGASSTFFTYCSYLTSVAFRSTMVELREDRGIMRWSR